MCNYVNELNAHIKMKISCGLYWSMTERVCHVWCDTCKYLCVIVIAYSIFTFTCAFHCTCSHRFSCIVEKLITIDLHAITRQSLSVCLWPATHRLHYSSLGHGNGVLCNEWPTSGH